MCALNIHTLPDDLLYELLIKCRDLISLKRLILTHPAIYRAFNSCRRLILRTVFKTQGIGCLRPYTHEQYLVNADRYIACILPCNAIDHVALRETLWPMAKQSMPSVISCQWALALLTRYHQAGLKHNELTFAKEAAHTMLSTSLPLHFSQNTLFRAIARTYTDSDTLEEAMELDAAILQRLDPRSHAHRVWIEDFMHTYQNSRNDEKGLDLQLRCWQLCRDTLGPGSQISLACARSLVCSYQLRGEHDKAFEFCRFVCGSLSPLTPGYTAWLRKSIDMFHKASHNSEA